MSSIKEANGRVDVLHQQNLTQYDFFNENNKDTFHFQSNAVRHIHTDTPVASLFFSQLNIDSLQDAIRYQVFSKTNNKHVIGKQSETELQIVMRSIYLQYGKHLDNDVVEQVRGLNGKVLDYVVPRILVELNQFVNYRNDITYLPVPLERSKNMSTSGTKFLQMKNF